MTLGRPIFGEITLMRKCLLAEKMLEASQSGKLFILDQGRIVTMLYTSLIRFTFFQDKSYILYEKKYSCIQLLIMQF